MDIPTPFNVINPTSSKPSSSEEVHQASRFPKQLKETQSPRRKSMVAQGLPSTSWTNKDLYFDYSVLCGGLFEANTNSTWPQNLLIWWDKGLRGEEGADEDDKVFPHANLNRRLRVVDHRRFTFPEQIKCHSTNPNDPPTIICTFAASIAYVTGTSFDTRTRIPVVTNISRYPNAKRKQPDVDDADESDLRLRPKMGLQNFRHRNQTTSDWNPINNLSILILYYIKGYIGRHCIVFSGFIEKRKR
ncbi:hypothetical protein CPB83DRAFT_841358 [Crepidotus variabilis]|uniref:Uncharacterized protein n=1 Tax=Crepidotus variabilis TaxID=179855 RepID=A0A9P6E069_9AGAR|nr:hypothetical protein CPB83DRAFT_841358 [Crepidotus variabilis]